MRIGIAVQQHADLHSILGAFEWADTQGLSSAWFPQTPTGFDAPTLLALASTRTRAVRLGTSVIPTYPRNPLVTAAVARTRSAAAPRRVILGVSAGHRSWIEEQYGLPFDTPISHVRDWVRLVRRLVDGEAVQSSDNPFGISATKAAPDGDLPIVLAATGRQMLAVAGEVADGVLTWMCDT